MYKMELCLRLFDKMENCYFHLNVPFFCMEILDMSLLDLAHKRTLIPSRIST